MEGKVRPKGTIFETALGWMGLVRSETGLKAVIMPKEDADLVRCEMEAHFPEPEENAEGFRRAREELLRYLMGEKVDFTSPLDWSDATSFQRKVWEATLSIPWGQSRSYLWVARRIGNPAAFRAVGQALGANPLPIIVPCHRIVTSAGGLGGYGGGLETKQRLLALEKCDLKPPLTQRL